MKTTTILVHKQRLVGYEHHCDSCQCEIWEDVVENGVPVMEERQIRGGSVVYDMSKIIRPLT